MQISERHWPSFERNGAFCGMTTLNVSDAMLLETLSARVLGTTLCKSTLRMMGMSRLKMTLRAHRGLVSD